jgi:predicted AlkP superfamily pyrophosphatase or phosphodiesterase
VTAPPIAGRAPRGPRAVLLWAVVLIAGCAGQSAPPLDRHLVLIIVDGLRPDAIAAAGARNIQGLLKESAHTLKARTVDPPETLPSHVSMATGLLPDAHGVHHNTDQGGTLSAPTVFTGVRAAGGRSALYFGKSKLALLSGPGNADLLWGPRPRGVELERGAVALVAARFAADFPRERFNFSFVHLREPDGAGHRHGWMSQPYFEALREADAAVGVILQAIAASDIAGRTAVILTTDHGGENKTHQSGSEASMLIPWMCRAPGIRAGAIGEPVRNVDTAPTVLALLGLPALPDTAGHAVAACLP